MKSRKVFTTGIRQIGLQQECTPDGESFALFRHELLNKELSESMLSFGLPSSAQVMIGDTRINSEHRSLVLATSGNYSFTRGMFACAVVTVILT